MGNCISRRRQATQTRNPTEGMSSTLNLLSMTHEIFVSFAKPLIWNALGRPVGKTRPLAPDPPLWRTDVRITRDQLLRKRDEFWDTAPVYEGRAEIWQALRAAAQAHEAGDIQLAQALITGANIFIPRGMSLCPLVYPNPITAFCYVLWCCLRVAHFPNSNVD